jgi:hypothetical protein
MAVDERLALDEQSKRVWGEDHERLRLIGKCIKAVAKTCAVLYEHRWWCAKAQEQQLTLSRIAGPGEGQLYMTGYSVPHAAIAFLFRTGSFNPADVVERNGGELACALCGAAGGDTPRHLLGLCNGSRSEEWRAKLVTLRAATRLLFGSNSLIDWNKAVYGLVGRERGVLAKDLTRERVSEGCHLLFEFYTLRRLARATPVLVAPAIAAQARVRQVPAVAVPERVVTRSAAAAAAAGGGGASAARPIV